MTTTDEEIAAQVTAAIPPTLAAPPAPSATEWPVMRSEGFHGPIGAYALTVARHTEADPVAVLATELAMFGVGCNRSAHLLAGNAPHPAALWVLIVGDTSTGAKGTSYSVARALMAGVVPDVFPAREQGGFGSGESIIDAVKDATDSDAGAEDLRLLLHETEYARAMTAAKRDGSTVSMVMRDAWDGNRLQSRTRGSGTTVATNYHLGMVAHITPRELAAKLVEVETWGGMSNRLLYFCSKRSRRCPDGGNVPAPVIDEYRDPLRNAMRTAWKRGTMTRTPEANERWQELYHQLADAQEAAEGSLYGAATARGAPYLLRLSLTFALADGADQICTDHLAAALAVWDYSCTSAGRLFSSATGDPVVDKLHGALIRAGSEGLTGSEQHRVFAGHEKAERVAAARDELERRGLATTSTEVTGGRPSVVTRAVTS